MSSALVVHTAAARWWPPLELAQAAPARAKPPEAAQRARVQAEAIAAIRALPVSPSITPPIEALARAGKALRRALSRGDAAAERLALQQALAAAHAQTRQSDAVLAAAWSLLSHGACALTSARERHQALALAAAAWGSSGRPCMVLAADDEGAATAARAGASLLAALGLRAALAPSDAAGSALRDAYAADVVYVPARRLAADLARDQRERGNGDASRLDGRRDTPLLTQGLHTVLIDELDRVLFDDAVNPVVLSVADDPTALGRAIAIARELADDLQPGAHYELHPRDGLLWTAEGAQGATRMAARLPPLWRTPARAELLLTQAIVVRDLLVLGRDYTVLANGPNAGQVHIDDSVVPRLPDRALLANLTQALQARLQLPLSDITRATDRSSVLSLVAGAHRLGGVAATLDGLAAPLWQRHGLSIDTPASTTTSDTPPWPLHTETLACAADWKARLQQLFTPDAEDMLRVFVLRHITDAARFAALPGAQGQPWVLASIGPARALAGLAGAPRDAPLRHIELVFTEPLESARAEFAFLCRAADACGLAVSGRVLLHPQGRWFSAALGALAPAAQAGLKTWPALCKPLLQTSLRLLRWRAARQHLRALAAMAQREQQLRLQLSFAGSATSTVAGPTETPPSVKRMR